ncbi:MAG: TIM barrel protein, partial [Verrucomicrobia bacterium]|nr:TIM barrel protein [Verrucomicrobiota bacterium]
MKNPLLDIRIGTLVSANRNSGNYIRQIIGHGFESFSLTFWQKLGDVRMKDLAQDVQAAIGDADVQIQCLGVFGNPLESRAIDKETVTAWKAAIDNAHLFGATMVAGFAGRLIDKPVPESMKQFKKVFGPLAQRAADRGVK